MKPGITNEYTRHLRPDDDFTSPLITCQVNRLEPMNWELAKEKVALNNGYRDFNHLQWLSDRGGMDLDDAYKEVAAILAYHARENNTNQVKPERPDAEPL